MQWVVGFGAFQIYWRKFISEVHTEYNQLETSQTKAGTFTTSVGYNVGLVHKKWALCYPLQNLGITIAFKPSKLPHLIITSHKTLQPEN